MLHQVRQPELWREGSAARTLAIGKRCYPRRVSAAGDSVLPDWSVRLISELDASDRRAERVARGLDVVQLNWQPRQGAWSVGQRLEHLRIANEVYLPAISAALDGRQPRTVDEVSLGWFSRRFIRTYIAPNPGGTRARPPKKIEPGKQVEPFV